MSEFVSLFGPPGSTEIDPQAISNTGEVVGYYYDSGQTTALVYNAGTYATLTGPGGDQVTSANGVNDSGAITGQFLDPDTDDDLGFIYSGGAYTILAGPDGTSGSPNGQTFIDPLIINDAGTVAGVLSGGDEPLHGFIYSGGNYTILSGPEPDGAVYLDAMNASGSVAGYYQYGSVGQDFGFIYSNGTYTYLTGPQGSTAVYVNAISDSGAVTGYYHDGQGNTYGFIYSNGTYTTITGPAGTASVDPTGINADGVVVGSYYNTTDNEFGFAYSNGVFTTLDGPAGEEGISPTAINNSGTITGSYYGYNPDNVFGSYGFTDVVTVSPAPEIFSQQTAATTGSFSGDFLWSNAGNWTDGVPVDGDNVTITADQGGIDELATLSLASVTMQYDSGISVAGSVLNIGTVTGVGLDQLDETVIGAGGAGFDPATHITVTIGDVTDPGGELSAYGPNARLYDLSGTDPGDIFSAYDGGTVLISPILSQTNSRLLFSQGGTSFVPGTIALLLQPSGSFAGLVADILPGAVLELPVSSVSAVIYGASSLTIATNAGAYVFSEVDYLPGVLLGSFTSSLDTVTGLEAVTFTTGPDVFRQAGNSELWSVAANWSLGVPVDGEDLVINGVSVDDIASLNPGAITLASPSGSVAVEVSSLNAGSVTGTIGTAFQAGSAIAGQVPGPVIVTIGTITGTGGRYQAFGQNERTVIQSAVDPGELYVVGNGGTVILAAAPAAGSTLEYLGSGTIALANPGANIAAALQDLDTGDVLELPGASVSAVDFGVGTITVKTSAGTYDFSNVLDALNINSYTAAFDPLTGLVAVTFTYAPGLDVFSRVQLAASGPHAGQYLWSNAANWTAGVPVDGDDVEIHGAGIDDVAGVSLDSLDLTGGSGTVSTAQALSIGTLTGDASSELIADGTLPASAASDIVTVAIFAATGGTYGAIGSNAVFADQAAASPANASYFAKAGGWLDVSKDLSIGGAATGTLSVKTGGTVTSVNGNIGTGTSDSGSATVDGAGSSWVMSGALLIGTQNGTGSPSLTISKQASVVTTANEDSGDILLGGSLLLETGGKLTEVALFMNNAATLTVESGATLNEVGLTTPNPTYIGLYGNGTINLDHGTLASANEYTVIGGLYEGAGNGTLTASDGAVASNLATYLGRDHGDSGTLILTGSGTDWTDTYGAAIDANDSGLNIGVNGTGNLTVAAGATLSNPLAYIKIGQYFDGAGTALVTGSGSSLSAGGLLRIGDSGTGTLTVADDGAVSAGQIQVGDFSGGTGTLDIDSGGVVATNSASTVDVGSQDGNGSTLLVPAGSFDIGVQGGSQGNVDVDAGTLDVFGTLTVGDGGVGTLDVALAGQVSAAALNVGAGSSNQGVLLVDGAGSSLAVTNLLTLGVQAGLGAPSITISNGARVSTDTGAANADNYDYIPDGQLTIATSGELTDNYLDMHNAATLVVESGGTLAQLGIPSDQSGYPADTFQSGLIGNGTLLFNDGTLASALAYTVIGEYTSYGGAGNGTLTALNGSKLTNLATDLGEYAGDSGALVLSGSATYFTDTAGLPVDHNDAGLNVGAHGSGDLRIADGATLSNPTSYIKIGQFAGAAGSATVTGAGSALDAGGLLRIGDSGVGTLTLENKGAATVGQVQVGDFSGSSGFLTITSGATLTTTDSTVDTGAQSGAIVTAGEFDIGAQSGSKGTVSVDGGTLTVQGELTVGDGGTGTLDIASAGLVSASALNVGTGSSNQGVLSLDGAGSSLAISGALVIGTTGGAGSPSITVANAARLSIGAAGYQFDGDGSMTIASGATYSGTEFLQDGASLLVQSGGLMALAGLSDGAVDPLQLGLEADGTVVFNDATLAASNARAFIGISLLAQPGTPQTGTLTALNGARLTNLTTNLAQEAGTGGGLVLTGAGTTYSNTGGETVDDNDSGLNVGVYGTGSLLVAAGAMVSNPTSYIKIGQFAGATGFATVTGAGSEMNAGGLLRVGDSGIGTLTLENDGAATVGQVQVGDYAGSAGYLTIESGGILTTTDSTVDTGVQLGATVTAGEFDIGVQSGSTGAVLVDGGTLNVFGTLLVGDRGTGALTVAAGGTVTTPVLDVGAGGSVILDTGGTVFAGGVHIGAGGAVQLAGGLLDPPDQIIIDAGGRIDGFGTLVGDIVNDGVILADPSTLSFDGAITGSGTIEIGADSDAIFNGAVSASETIEFLSTSGTLTIDDPAAFKGTILGLGTVITGGATQTAAPVITAPAAIAVIAGQAETISGIILSEIGNTPQETFTVTLRDYAGLLAAGGAGVSGAGSHVLTISGSLDQVNADLDTVTATNLFAGTRTISLSAYDSSGGKSDIVRIAVATSAAIAPGTPLTIAAGQTSYDLVVGNGSSEIITSGAHASCSTIAAGGVLGVAPGGLITATNVEGGVVGVLGKSVGTQVDAGYELVGYSGFSENTLIRNGAYQYVLTQGTAENTRIATGGTMLIGVGGQAQGSIDFAGSDAVLSIAGTAMPEAILNGFDRAGATDDAIILTGYTYAAGQDTASLGSGGILTLDLAGASEKLQLDPSTNIAGHGFSIVTNSLDQVVVIDPAIGSAPNLDFLAPATAAGSTQIMQQILGRGAGFLLDYDDNRISSAAFQPGLNNFAAIATLDTLSSPAATANLASLDLPAGVLSLITKLTSHP